MPARPPVIWRWVICDLDGHAISIITGLADDVQVTFELNRPAQLTLTVPSDNPLINTAHTDGDPYLAPGNRMIKGYRKVSTGADITPGGWVLAYVGRTYIVDDEGDGTTVRTAVTCFDPLMDLAKRIVRDNAGAYSPAFDLGPLSFGNIIKAMVDNTNAFGRSATMVTTFGGSFESSTGPFTENYDLQYVLPSIITLTDTGICDLVPEYLDATDHIHLQLGVVQQRGTDKHLSVVLGYDAPPRTAQSYARQISMEDFANDVIMYGKSRSTTAAAHDAGSITKYDSFESVEVETGITASAILTQLVTEQINLRRTPKDMLTLVPAPEIAPLPITDWDLGDLIGVNAAVGTNPSTRQSATGVQRVYGYTLDISSDYGERVSSLILSASAE